MMNNKKQVEDVKLTQTGMMRQPSRPNRTRRVAEKSATLSRPLHNNHICHRSPVSHVGTKMARVLTNLPCSMSSTQTNPTQALPNTQLSRQSFVANNHEHNTSTCNHSRRNMVCSTKDDSAAQIDVLQESLALLVTKLDGCRSELDSSQYGRYNWKMQTQSAQNCKIRRDEIRSRSQRARVATEFGRIRRRR